MSEDKIGVLRYTALNYDHEVEAHTIHICGVCAFFLRDYELNHGEVK